MLPWTKSSPNPFSIRSPRKQELTFLAKYDQESSKTVGLANEIINQSQRQRADLFWNNEILHSLRLKQKGLLEVYETPLSANYPVEFVSRDQDWFGFAARARVLLINTEIMPDQEYWPDSVNDLSDPKWKDKCAIARPLFGTTATHAAVLFDRLGSENAILFFNSLKKNAAVESGNKQVAQKVASGQYAFGLTDTDDAIIELERGASVAMVFPDQVGEQPGTLFIPNTLCILKDGPNTENAKQLVDYLLTEDVEARLAKGASAQIPLSSRCNIKSRISPEKEIRFMNVDFEAAAKNWDRVSQILSELFPLSE